jgi:hypothetical protein
MNEYKLKLCDSLEEWEDYNRKVKVPAPITTAQRFITITLDKAKPVNEGPLPINPDIFFVK